MLDESVDDEETADGLPESIPTANDVWSMRVGNFRPATLTRLLFRNRYNLLATRLIYIEGYSADTTVQAASAHSSLVAVIVGKKEYRALGYKIYEKRLR